MKFLPAIDGRGWCRLYPQHPSVYSEAWMVTGLGKERIHERLSVIVPKFRMLSQGSVQTE